MKYMAQLFLHTMEQKGRILSDRDFKYGTQYLQVPLNTSEKDYDYQFRYISWNFFYLWQKPGSRVFSWEISY